MTYSIHISSYRCTIDESFNVSGTQPSPINQNSSYRSHSIPRHTSSKFIIPEKVCFHSQLTPVQYVSKTNTIRIDGLCYYQDTWSAVAAANGCSAFKGFMMTPSISPYSLASLALMKKSRSVSWLIFSKL